MTHTVAVGEFEGPLGVLLELVERNKLQVTAISVASITEQFVERIHALGPQAPEELSEFLQLGARLLYIKSLALLPAADTGEQVEELRRLNLELEEYRRMQAGSRVLAGRAPWQTWQRTLGTRLEPHELPLPRLELQQLTEAFGRALRRTAITAPATVPRQHVSLEQTIARLRQRLTAGAFELERLLSDCHNRLEVIVTFLALLELMRASAARVSQPSQFAPIMVEPAHG
jgi:segregation and condensation protein A